MVMTSFMLQIHELLIAAVLIVSFSLLVYIALHNWRNDIARALCVLLASVTIVYGGDVLIGRADRLSTIQFLLRAQWLGIALVPAAYIHLSNALHKSSLGFEQTHKYRWLVWISYIGGVLFFLLALHTNLILREGTTIDVLAYFTPGPLFWLYGVFFASSIIVAFVAISHARRDALTPTLRRRITYLRASFIAPGLGVFPYLILAGGSLPLSRTITLLLAAFVSLGVAILITIMTYSVGFQGVLIPDRLIKQDFIRWGLYGPFVGVTIILCIQIVPWLDSILGLPSDTLITFVVMIMTVLMPIFVSKARPYLDALVYMQDQEEIDYLRGLPRNIFTVTDLRQLLENTLVAVCGALQAETGFVVGPSKDGYTVKALCGSRRSVKRFVAEHPLYDLMTQLERVVPVSSETTQQTDTFVSCNSFCLLPLRSPDGMFLGALGVSLSSEALYRYGSGMLAESRHLIDVLTHHMELAMTTVNLQQRIFENLRGLDPEMKVLQQLTTKLDQATPATLATLENDVLLDPHFSQLVKDALSHYWGGPKLFESPLLELRTVRRLMQQQEHNGHPTKALQTVLRQAINNIRPDEQLDPSAQEWLLYNILEMRFLQGRRIRDVAKHLSMSESDYYRKQRIAVEEVARQLVMMEDGEKAK